MNNLIRQAFALFAVTVAYVAVGAAAASPPASHYTYVIVHGALGGGWAFREIDRLLTADGHKVYRPTLTGQGEKVHLASPEITLTTHIDDIVNVILFEDLKDIVLVGHSYGGMVITGVMDRVPERIQHVIFTDAVVPDDGENFITAQRSIFDGANWEVKSGFVMPPAGSTASQPIPHAVPQSYKTWTEPVSFKNPAAKNLQVTFVRFLDEGQTVESKLYYIWQRAVARGWTTRTMVSDHNAHKSHPKELVALLEEAPKDRNKEPNQASEPTAPSGRGSS